MTQKWNSHFSFHWNPLVAFTQRRAELANWIDKNVDARGVLDHEDFLGVAISDPDLRVTLSRTGFDISLGKAKLTLEPLAEFVRGMVTVISPGDVHIASASIAYSVALEGNYEALCASFAQRSLGSTIPDIEAVDGAILTDLKSRSGTLHVEFGVVTADELRSRLKDPTIGRAASARAPGSKTDLTDAGVVPPVALFCDSLWRVSSRTAMPSSGSAQDIWEYITSMAGMIEAECSSVAEAIAATITDEGGANEYSRGA